MSYAGNLDRAPTHDLKGNKIEQSSIFASVKIFTSMNRDTFIKGILGKCNNNDMKVLVKGCQHIVTKIVLCNLQLASQTLQ